MSTKAGQIKSWQKSEKLFTERNKRLNFEAYLLNEEPSSWFPLIEWKWLVPDPMRGSWIFYQTERVWIVFRGLMSCPNTVK